MSRITIAAAVMTMLTAGNAVAQVPSGSHVVGRVTDASGSVIPGVTVLVRGANVRRAAMSDSEGRFDVSDVPPGSYELTTTIPGFEGERRRIALTAPDYVIDVSLTLTVSEFCDPPLYVDAGFADAVDGSDAILHVRVERIEPTKRVTPTKKTSCSYAAVTYTASVIEALKSPVADRLSTVQWVQDSSSVMGPMVGQEYLVLLYRGSASLLRYTAGNGLYVFGLRGGGVEWHRDDVPGMHDGDPIYHLIDTIREILALRDRR